MVHIAHPDTGVFQIIGEALRHFLGEGGDQHTLVFGGAGVDLPDEVVDLTLHRTHLHHGIQQAGGADDLLGDLAGAGALVLAGGGRHVDHLIEPLLKFLKLEGTVVKGAGQAEAVVHQGGLSCPVTVVHGVDLGKGHVTLVNEQDEVLGEIVQQGVGG